MPFPSQPSSIVWFINTGDRVVLTECEKKILLLQNVIKINLQYLMQLGFMSVCLQRFH